MKKNYIILSTLLVATFTFAGCGTTASVNTNANTNTNTAVDTSGWKTYTNDEYGFSFRYSSTMSQIVTDNYGYAPNLNFVKDIRLNNDEKGENNTILDFGVTDLSLDKLTSAIEKSDQLPNGDSLAKVSKIDTVTLNGVTAYKGSHATAIGIPTLFYYLPLKNNKALFIYYWQSPAQQIINTVTINNELDTSNSQTYTNKDYGFSLKYPKEWGTIQQLSGSTDPFVAIYKFSNTTNIANTEPATLIISNDKPIVVNNSDWAGFFDYSKIDFNKTENQLAEDLKITSSDKMMVRKIVINNKAALKINRTFLAINGQSITTINILIQHYDVNNQYNLTFTLDESMNTEIDNVVTSFKF